MEIIKKSKWPLFLGFGFALISSIGLASQGHDKKPTKSTVSQKADIDKSDSYYDDLLTPKLYKPYPTGFYVGAALNLFYRDMRTESAWRFTYDGDKKYRNSLWGPAANIEVGYQANQHWGLALQGGWVGEQKVISGNSTSTYNSGDSERLNTCWAAALLRMRLKMDYKYYFIAEFGPAYVMQRLSAYAISTNTTTRSNDNKILPTAVIGIQYRATEQLNVGLQYQLIWGQQNWRNAWAGGATHYPPLQMLGIKLSYQFNS